MSGEYAKIKTLFVRDTDFRVDTARVRRPEFAAIDRWCVDEKLDGMNCRLILRPDAVPELRGRTDAATVPVGLVGAVAPRLCGRDVASLLRPGQVGLVVYGEGIGPKINGNPHGLDHFEFRVFDVRPIVTRSFETGHVDDEDILATHIASHEVLGQWLDREDVCAVAKALRLEMVPEIGVMPTPAIVDFVRNGGEHDGPGVRWTYLGVGGYLEGVVCRPLVELRDRRGERVVCKLKVRDFKEGRR